MSEKQLSFIVSGGRTGTQSFGDLLGTVVSDCHSEHEPDMVAGLSRLTWDRIRRFGLWHMLPGRLLGQTGVRVIGQRYRAGSLSAEVAHARLRATRQAYHAANPQSLIVESYAAWWMVAADIPVIWPGAKVAGVLRDPRDWIASWLKHSVDRRNGAWTERLPPGPLEPSKLGDRQGAQLWPGLDQIGRLAWEWGTIAEALTEAAARRPEIEVFRFEDLFGRDPTPMERFVQFIATHATGPRHDIGDLSTLRGDVRNASPGVKPRWSDWSDRQIAAIDRFCGPQMLTYGYGQEPEWQARIASIPPLGAD